MSQYRSYEPPPLSPVIEDRQRYQMVYKLTTYDQLVWDIKYNRWEGNFDLLSFFYDREKGAKSLLTTYSGNVKYNIFQGPGNPSALDLDNEQSRDRVQAKIGK